MKEIIDRAIARYIQFNEREYGFFDQPSRDSSEIVGEKIILRNVNGELAKYQVYPSGRIKRIENVGEVVSR